MAWRGAVTENSQHFFILRIAYKLYQLRRITKSGRAENGHIFSLGQLDDFPGVGHAASERLVDKTWDPGFQKGPGSFPMRSSFLGFDQHAVNFANHVLRLGYQLDPELLHFLGVAGDALRHDFGFARTP